MSVISEVNEVKTVDWDAQKKAQLASRLNNMGFENTQAQSAAASVQVSGAFDMMDTKPSSIGAFIQAIKSIKTQKAVEDATMSSAEPELANSL